MKFKIATPEKVVLEAEVDSLTLPTTLGEITILKNHIPLAANLVAGEIRYKSAGHEDFFAVSGGIVEVKGHNEIVVLADSAEFGHEIDMERAEQARIAAQKLMSEVHADERAFADASAVFQRNLARLRVAKKHRSHATTRVESNN